ncbi:MAG TPA: Hsp33 family molecular chaperone HslO [Sorangium sp.]|nr:Hsp33 family molecular chaperone HslO [Sorangium sp.]
MTTTALATADGPSTRSHVLRAITETDDFRVMVATTSEVVRAAVEAQKLARVNAEPFADLLTGTILIRETMSPAHRVQAVLRGGSGQGSLVSDSHPDGLTRGLVQGQGDKPFHIGADGSLLMMRAMSKGLHRSMVQPPAGSSVAVALMTYLQESEQIVSMIDTATVWHDGQIQLAGGYVVQLLPDANRAALAVMAQRLEDFPPWADMLQTNNGCARALLDEILYSMPFTQLDDRPVSFGCTCNQQAVVASLATLSRDDVAEIVRDQAVVELTCDYCNRNYQLRSTQLQGLLSSS